MYDVDAFAAWLEALDKRNLLDKVHVLAGVGPLRSAKSARYIATQLHNVSVPPAILARMESARDAPEEGIQIALEIIARLRTMKGVSGIHLMAMGGEAVIPRIVTDAGLAEQQCPTT